jgi:hypothetical protein
MDKDYKSTTSGYNEPGEKSPVLFDNLIWLTTKETAVYLRRSVNALYVLVHRGILRPRKFSRRLYFKKAELDYVLETSKI